jgi:hypothetical protein
MREQLPYSEGYVLFEYLYDRVCFEAFRDKKYVTQVNRGGVLS